MREKDQVLEGIVQDETVTYSLVELCEICVVSEETITEIIEYGIVSPVEEAPNLAFNAQSLPRIKKAIRLQQDLAINWSGVSLVLELLDEITLLRQQIQILSSE
ncbi:MAG: chaperone modulator CbpM [Candidatus Berkiellales bacterium]